MDGRSPKAHGERRSMSRKQYEGYASTSHGQRLKKLIRERDDAFMASLGLYLSSCFRNSPDHLGAIQSKHPLDSWRFLEKQLGKPYALNRLNTTMSWLDTYKYTDWYRDETKWVNRVCIASGVVRPVLYCYTTGEGKEVDLNQAWNGEDRQLLHELNEVNKSLINIMLYQCEHLLEVLSGVPDSVVAVEPVGHELEEDELEESEVEVEIEPLDESSEGEWV